MRCRTGRVGGIQDQITHDQSGLLLDDPCDLGPRDWAGRPTAACARITSHRAG
jgi:hypothetical protein